MDQRKRYQIFVSSTFRDLEEERGKVMETILNFDCFPAGMEMFPAMDEDIFKYIKRIIDESDYYLLIIGGCYGSVDKKGKSWTEREYEYAVKKGIPVIAFDHKDFTTLPTNKTDQDDKKRKKLIAFKKKVATGRLIKKWTDSKDLALAIATSLKSVLQLQPGIGWVRADKVISGDSQEVIDKLNAEIEKYKKEVKRLENDLKQKGDLESKFQTAQHEIEELKKQKKALNERFKKLEAELEQYKPLSGDVVKFTVEGVSFKMVHVLGGTFMMGANKGDVGAFNFEKPTHEVTLSDYWMGETQVTQALWQVVMGENPSVFEGDPNLPVENVSWRDCKDFIRKLNGLTGKEFRLPTEAQWEFAARGGNLGKDNHYLYAGSNVIDDVAWYDENSNGKTHPVGERDPNELGLYDMTGNVHEWCNDWYGEQYYRESPAIDPTGPSSGTYRVCRGGCWFNSARNGRVSKRDGDEPSCSTGYYGLRLAL